MELALLDVHRAFQNVQFATIKMPLRKAVRLDRRNNEGKWYTSVSARATALCAINLTGSKMLCHKSRAEERQVQFQTLPRTRPKAIA